MTLVAVHAPRCLLFWGWAFAGGLALLTTVSFIGVFTAVPALALLVLVGRIRPRWPESLGLLTGFGGLCVAIAILNTGESNGLDATPWWAAGAVLAVAGVAGYAAVRARQRSESEGVVRDS
jgi:hypothetical protein